MYMETLNNSISLLLSTFFVIALKFWKCNKSLSFCFIKKHKSNLTHHENMYTYMHIYVGLIMFQLINTSKKLSNIFFYAKKSHGIPPHSSIRIKN